ncbi:MAG: heme exporter protein CcmD [Thermoanaerobaculia bacterium]|nr:heme exporter protein CcmD [Thermoanaerobaculia bacterium]
MAEGVIVGGWSYVIVAYGVTALGLIAHTLSLVVRRKHLRRASRRKETTEDE